MPHNPRTDHLGLPLPHLENQIDEDNPRLGQALSLLDANAAEQDAALSSLSSRAQTLEGKSASLEGRASALESRATAQENRSLGLARDVDTLTNNVQTAYNKAVEAKNAIPGITTPATPGLLPPLGLPGQVPKVSADGQRAEWRYSSVPTPKRQVITESGTFTTPVSGIYTLTLIAGGGAGGGGNGNGGGQGGATSVGMADDTVSAVGGSGGAAGYTAYGGGGAGAAGQIVRERRKIPANVSLEIIIGAGGIPGTSTSGAGAGPDGGRRTPMYQPGQGAAGAQSASLFNVMAWPGNYMSTAGANGTPTGLGHGGGGGGGRGSSGTYENPLPGLGVDGSQGGNGGTGGAGGPGAVIIEWEE